MRVFIILSVLAVAGCGGGSSRDNASTVREGDSSFPTNPNDTTDYGIWRKRPFHLFGTTSHTQFGIAERNGYITPWTEVSAPIGDVIDNAGLGDSNGAASWSGVIVGLSDQLEVVRGNAHVDIDLHSLYGTASFTELSVWDYDFARGEVSLGGQWLDGDLRYTIRVDGNTFRRFGGDDGVLTGEFSGAQHEGVAGTIERDDFKAAFGAER